MYKINQMHYDFLVEVTPTFSPFSIVYEHTADAALLLASLVPHISVIRALAFTNRTIIYLIRENRTG